jgi:hypothetical protein
MSALGAKLLLPAHKRALTANSKNNSKFRQVGSFASFAVKPFATYPLLLLTAEC